jgi:hypothetical protein
LVQLQHPDRQREKASELIPIDLNLLSLGQEIPEFFQAFDSAPFRRDQMIHRKRSHADTLLKSHPDSDTVVTLCTSTAGTATTPRPWYPQLIRF